ncbi:hypothetical protein evm_012309 [Chilo suppressalis]|nr:hypothetical protein evm_012309 [Chilo suppressalis]
MFWQCFTLLIVLPIIFIGVLLFGAFVIVPCAFIFASWYMRIKERKLQRRKRDGANVAFFHPYCKAGGGGERVLWVAIKALLARYPDTTIYIYTVETAEPQAILDKAHNQFNVRVDLTKINFVRLALGRAIEARTYPYFTLLLQSLGSMVLGMEAFMKFNPVMVRCPQEPPVNWGAHRLVSPVGGMAPFEVSLHVAVDDGPAEDALHRTAGPSFRCIRPVRWRQERRRSSGSECPSGERDLERPRDEAGEDVEKLDVEDDEAADEVPNDDPPGRRGGSGATCPMGGGRDDDPDSATGGSANSLLVSTCHIDMFCPSFHKYSSRKVPKGPNLRRSIRPHSRELRFHREIELSTLESIEEEMATEQQSVAYSNDMTERIWKSLRLVPEFD